MRWNNKVSRQRRFESVSLSSFTFSPFLPYPFPGSSLFPLRFFFFSFFHSLIFHSSAIPPFDLLCLSPFSLPDLPYFPHSAPLHIPLSFLPHPSPSPIPLSLPMILPPSLLSPLSFPLSPHLPPSLFPLISPLPSLLSRPHPSLFPFPPFQPSVR